jgi:hypothetical protein
MGLDMNLDGFRIGVFRFEYIARETVLMPPYKGGVLRGGFGAALKKVACTAQGGACEGCILKGSCAYSRVFETPIPYESKYLHGRGFAPHPFVLGRLWRQKLNIIQMMKYPFRLS